MKSDSCAIQIVTERSGPGIVSKTVGLHHFTHTEISVDVGDRSLLEEAEDILRVISEYVIKCGAQIEPEQTLNYGYWLTKFREREKRLLETWEYNAAATDFVRGAALTLTYWRDQHLICNKHEASFEPPVADQLSVVSKGVFEGLPVQGVRYPSPDQMSGWWITTDEYNGDVKTLQREHTYHVTAVRPELAKYLALPRGFRFDFSKFEDVWFDEDVIKS